MTRWQPPNRCGDGSKKLKIDKWHPCLDEKLITWLQIENNLPAKALLPAIWQEALELIQPHTWTCRLEREDFFERFSPHARQSKVVCRLLEEATGVWLLVATIGEGLESRARSLLQQRESFHGYILDRLGSFLVEDIISTLDASVGNHCQQQGGQTTRRYSPGYRDFSLAAQQIFVDMACSDIPYLQVNSGHILKPEKSVTAIKGEI